MNRYAALNILMLTILVAASAKSYDKSESPEVSILKKALRVYAGEHVVDRVMQQGEKAFSRGLKSAMLTLMFVEVAPVQVQTDKPLMTQQMMDTINSSLNTVAECIDRHKGIVDNFNGDVVFAYWGLDGKVGHEIQASRCALDCVESLVRLSKKNEKAGLPTLRVRIGINTGTVAVGNVGSDHRMKFAVLGDHVNTAYGLAGMCGSFPDTQVLISESTRKNLGDSFSSQLVGNVRVKGRDEPLSLFSLRTK